MRPGGAHVDARLIVGDLVPNIKILPLDRVIEAADGLTIMEAAHEHGLYWPTTCGGGGICTPLARPSRPGGGHPRPRWRRASTNQAQGVSGTARSRRGPRLRCQP